MNDVKRINLDDYIQTGEGATALTYTSKDGKTLAKLYNLGFEVDRAKEEFLTAQIVFEMGIPTPEPYRLVTDGERLGGEYELIKGKRSFARIISQEPERLEEISLEFARMTKGHRVPGTVCLEALDAGRGVEKASATTRCLRSR